MNKFLVIQTNERIKNIVKLKSALAEKSIDDLVINALDEHTVKPLRKGECLYCKGHLVEKLKDKKATFADNPYIIKDYPVGYCKKCDADFDDLQVANYTQKLAEGVIKNELKKRKGFLREIQFADLLKIKNE